jgi:outer membrane protein OmpA-like peptidoglycan-associated protein
MSRLGKCHNYSGCLLAYRGEQTEVPDGQPFVCAECGKPLTEVKTSPVKMIAMIGTALLVAALAIGAFAMWPLLTDKFQKKKPSEPPATPAVAQDEQPGATPLPNPDKKGDAEPPVEVVAPAKITLQVDEKLKREVLKRIDLMPNVSKANKDKLYNAVERARKMGIVLTVPFEKGKTAISPTDTAALKAAMEKQETMDLRDDPTAVFVVLGYADPKGDAKANLGYSQSRADSVVAAMKRDAGVQNVVHAVAMGGSSLLDEKNLEKNRIAEVWVVLP